MASAVPSAPPARTARAIASASRIGSPKKRTAISRPSSVPVIRAVSSDAPHQSTRTPTCLVRRCLSNSDNCFAVRSRAKQNVSRLTPWPSTAASSDSRHAGQEIWSTYRFAWNPRAGSLCVAGTRTSTPWSGAASRTAAGNSSRTRAKQSSSKSSGLIERKSNLRGPSAGSAGTGSLLPHAAQQSARN